MAGHYENTVEDQVTGKPVNGATVKVYQDGATIAADGKSVTSGTLATIFSDDGVTTIDQSTSPLTTPSNGGFDFYTDDPRVIIEVSFNGVGLDVWNDVDIPGNGSQAAVTALAVRVSATESIIGLASPNTDLGTFSGSTISDNNDIQGALQELETAVESAGSGATEASTTEIFVGSETGKYISPDKFRTATAPVTLTDAATIGVDFETGRNFTVTLGGNRTLGNPTNVQAGDSGLIYVVQDGTGSRTLTLASNWNPIGGAPTIDGTASAVNVFTYFARSTTEITLSFVSGGNATSGTSFPSSPSMGDRFYRTDRNIDYYYDGTRWLSTQLHTLSIDGHDAVNPLTASSIRRGMNPFWDVYDVYVEEFIFSSINTATTAANYFTATLSAGDGAGASTLASGISTQNDTQSVRVGHRTTIDTVVSSSVEQFDITYTETGTASAYIVSALTYRLVG